MRLPAWRLIRVSGSGFKVRTGFRRGWVKDWVVSREFEGFESVGGKTGLDDRVAASFHRSRIRKPHANTHAFKVNRSTSRSLILNFPTIKEPQTQVDQESQIKMIQVKEMMQDNDLKNSKSKDKGSRSRSQSMSLNYIKCGNGTEFKNSIMNQFCEIKGIKREFSVVGTPQQNGVAERKNRTLIEAARTMLVDSNTGA
ncbi:putative ribonuclease H-like domain-containing protein [Tanacetum coccineum]